MSRPASATGSDPAISCSKIGLFSAVYTCLACFSRFLHLFGLFQPVLTLVWLVSAGSSSGFAVSLPQLPDAELDFAVQGG